MALSAHGIGAQLPARFEGRIFVRASVGGEISRPVAQFATFPIPPGNRGLRREHSNQHGSIRHFRRPLRVRSGKRGTALFAVQGIPSGLTTMDFLPYVMRPGVGGSLGIQRFFTVSRRPFMFYARLGSLQQQAALVQQVNQLLANLVIQPLAPTPLVAPDRNTATATSTTTSSP